MFRPCSPVSGVLGVSMKTVYRLIRDECLTCLKVGRAFRVPKAMLMAYIKLWGIAPCGA